MKATRAEVQQMVVALMTVNRGLERARQRDEVGKFAALLAVATRGGARPSDIAEELGVHQSTITRQVRDLEAAGHVAVTADAIDRRSCTITLTPEGVKEIDRLTEIGLARFENVVADWDAEEVRTFGSLLAKFSASAEAARPAEPKPAGRSWQKRARRDN